MLGFYKTILLKQCFKKESGFTLIELLIVVIIVGILSAIAIPSFLGNTAKAKQTEAKMTVGSVNKAQQAYRLENNRFAENMAELGIGLPTNTSNYDYTITQNNNTATVVAKTKDDALKGYSGGVVRFTLVGNNVAATSIICENRDAGVETPNVPALNPAANTPETAALCASNQSKLQ